MARDLLDLRVSIFDGPTASISELMLFAHVRGRPSSGGEYLVLCPGEPDGAPARCRATELAASDLERLLDRIGATGLPGRIPRIVPGESLLPDGPLLTIALRAGGSARSFDLPLRGAGFSGADAAPLGETLIQLVELAPMSRRASVRSVIGRVLGERRAGWLAPASIVPAIAPIGTRPATALSGWQIPRPTGWEPDS